MEHMDTDMHKMIYSANDLTDDHIQYFLWQVTLPCSWALDLFRYLAHCIQQSASRIDVVCTLVTKGPSHISLCFSPIICGLCILLLVFGILSPLVSAHCAVLAEPARTQMHPFCQCDAPRHGNSLPPQNDISPHFHPPTASHIPFVTKISPSSCCPAFRCLFLYFDSYSSCCYLLLVSRNPVIYS